METPPVEDTGTICQPDLVPQELCFLPGAQIQDVAERLQRRILPSGYYLLLLVHAGISDTTGVTLCMSRMTPELWWQGKKALGAVFWLLLVKGKGAGTVGKCCWPTAGVRAGLWVL